MTDFFTTPNTIIEALSETVDGMTFIPEANFKQLIYRIENYSDFRCSMEMAGADL